MLERADGRTACAEIKQHEQPAAEILNAVQRGSVSKAVIPAVYHAPRGYNPQRVDPTQSSVSEREA
jgi:hypothetical protein